MLCSSAFLAGVPLDFGISRVIFAITVFFWEIFAWNILLCMRKYDCTKNHRDQTMTCTLQGSGSLTLLVALRQLILVIFVTMVIQISLILTLYCLVTCIESLYILCLWDIVHGFCVTAPVVLYQWFRMHNKLCWEINKLKWLKGRDVDRDMNCSK